ncbi:MULTISPECIES: DUF4012 domain-containing protein [Micromonospora]|uniref:DUF4012 domain-containing protein n=1 Tax=Micromonospora TaxID=1873 RepID=UPI001E448BAF|nr:DUF4012 domain-containing protein [Micromonospora yangpuensis]
MRWTTPRPRLSRRRRRIRRRRALLATLVACCLLVVSVGWVGLRGWQARAHLLNAAELAQELSAQLTQGDTDRAQRTLSALQEQARQARAATAGPTWSIAGWLPYVGDDLDTVGQIAAVIDDLSRHAFPSLLRVDLTALLPRGGKLDLSALKAVAGPLTAGDEAVQRNRARLAGLSTDGLLPQVGAALTALRQETDRLSQLTATASQGARVLPALLGADGPRSYLLVSQNLAEVRATGGMLGAYALIRADDGRVRIVSQGSSSATLLRFDPPVDLLSTEMRHLYTDLPGVFPGDVNLTPHFPTAAKLYREMVRRRTGTTVDGVLAVDPVALSYLLAATGPVTVPDGPKLTAQTAVRTLLSDAYLRLDTVEQDEFFSAAASAVFNSLLARQVSLPGVLSALSRSVHERRILFWSARAAEQQILTTSRVAGTLPEQEKEPTVGVFLNDGTGAKLSYYLTQTANLTVGACRPDGRRSLRLRLTLHSSVPRDGLTSSVLGPAKHVPPYTVRTLVNVFSPAGGTVLGGRLDGTEVALGSGTERGRHVVVANVELGPGKSRTLEVDLLTAVDTTVGTAHLWHTPTATPWTTQIDTAPACH